MLFFYPVKLSFLNNFWHAVNYYAREIDTTFRGSCINFSRVIRKSRNCLKCVLRFFCCTELFEVRFYASLPMGWIFHDQTSKLNSTHLSRFGCFYLQLYIMISTFPAMIKLISYELILAFSCIYVPYKCNNELLEFHIWLDY